MKLKFLIPCLFAFVIPTLAFAQADGSEIDWLDGVKWAAGGLASADAISKGVLLLTQLIKKWFKTNGTVTMIISWISGFAIAAVGKLLASGMFIEAGWIYTLIVGLTAGLVANRYFSIEEIRDFLSRKLPKYKI